MNLRRLRAGGRDEGEPIPPATPKPPWTPLSNELERELLEVNAYIRELADFLVPMHNKGEIFIPLSLRRRLLEVRKRVRHQ
jgi:hypothetical protein